jgi:hypothetical protein
VGVVVVAGLQIPLLVVEVEVALADILLQHLRQLHQLHIQLQLAQAELGVQIILVLLAAMEQILFLVQ